MKSINGRKLRCAARSALLTVVGFGLAVPAFATPPSHAPAHGWRKKHDPYYLGYTGREWGQDYGIIEGHCNREAIGTVLGGTLGGAIGSQIGDGDERVIAIVLGTVIGAAIGREIGRNLDDKDRACVGHALELAKDGQKVSWVNEASGVSYVLTPLAAAKSADTCRDFELQLTRAGKAQSQKGRACRTGDGTWEMNH